MKKNQFIRRSKIKPGFNADGVGKGGSGFRQMVETLVC